MFLHVHGQNPFGSHASEKNKQNPGKVVIPRRHLLISADCSNDMPVQRLSSVFLIDVVVASIATHSRSLPQVPDMILSAGRLAVAQAEDGGGGAKSESRHLDQLNQ